MIIDSIQSRAVYPFQNAKKSIFCPNFLVSASHEVRHFVLPGLYCIDGVVIAAQCTATFLRSIVLPEFRY